MLISWYQRMEQREITEGYRGYMEFDIAFVSWVKVLLDLLKLSNFLCIDPIFPKTKIICFWLQTMKNDWVWRKVFERYVLILRVLVDIVGVLFFRLVSLFEKLDSKFESYWIIKNTSQHFNIVAHLLLLNFPLEYAKRLVT